MHFDLYLYALVARRILPTSALAEVALAEVRESCTSCCLAWSVFTELRLGEPGFGAVSQTAPLWPRPLPRDGRELSNLDVESRAALMSRVRMARRRGMEDLRKLLSLPAMERAQCVHRSKLRYRSRAVAELLLDECRRRVRSEPSEAENLASLVPMVLDRIPSAEGKPWRASLAARAAAHEANALRVAGDLPAADRRFLDVERMREAVPALASQTCAELASLEASLRIDQRRSVEAKKLLESAVKHYRRGHDSDGEARALLQFANLLRNSGRPEAILDRLKTAADRLGSKSDPYLLLCTVTGRVNALCDLDRPDEAGALLDTHRKLYSESDDPYTAVMLRALDGRVALGQGRHAKAAEELGTACDTFLELGRGYDAALAALYLAEVHLEAGQLRELKRLAAELIPSFQARSVEREAMVAVQLLARSAQARQVTAALLADLRDRVQRAGHSPHHH